jgi:hypothetical protein
MLVVVRVARWEASGRRDSNPRPSTWEADALPTELLPHGWWDGYWCWGTLVSILSNGYSGIAWEASTLPLSYTRNQLSILSNGMSADVKDKLFWWYKCQQFPGNFGIFGDEE